MNKIVILSCLILLGLASCATHLERLCKDFTIEEFIFRANCKIDDTYEPLTLDLNTCLGTKNGLLNYPGSGLLDNCDKCYIKDTWNLYCNCYRSERRTSDSTEEARMRNLLLSYMDFRQFITYEDGRLSC